MLLGTFLFIYVEADAQSILDRKLTINAKGQKLGTILSKIEEKEKFHFSFNSSIIPPDSIVSIAMENRTIREALDLLLNGKYEYRETSGFLILRYAPGRLSLIAHDMLSVAGDYQLKGYVIDMESGKRLAKASVYEKNQLQSTMTDKHGYFELKLHSEYAASQITLSKENYRDTSLIFLADVKVFKRKGSKIRDFIDKFDYTGSEFSDFFLSAKQKIKALNIAGLIAEVPFQASLTPGLGSHGALSGKVNNKFSLNVIGGYNGGVDGLEVGGIFNLDRADVRYLQMAGVTNLVGGNLQGLQVAGFANFVYKDISGVQLAGLVNCSRLKFSGVQIGGVMNSIQQHFQGVQIAGVINNVRGSSSGVHLAGIGNFVKQDLKGAQISSLVNSVKENMRGIQFSGILNYSKTLTGVQIGLINVADSSLGVSIGIINFIPHGYHKVGVNFNELRTAEVSIRTGTENLYSIVSAGKEINKKEKLRTIGFGFGYVSNLTKYISINPELSGRYLFQGNRNSYNFLYRIETAFNIRINKFLGFNAGPSVNLLFSNQPDQVVGYGFVRDRNQFKIKHNRWSGWLGWSAGILVF